MSDFLQRQLIRLGDMMGDGQHHEPGGAWIEQEYKATMRALGIKPPRRPRADRSATINERMAQRVAAVRCQADDCGGELRQSRAGSTIAACAACGARWRLLNLNKGKTQ